MSMSRQSCSICAWRVTCGKRFCVTDGGARCPDFSRDVTIRSQEEPDSTESVDTPKES